jgi:UDP-N-acetylmuramoylalanine--D-glutamate ligase
MTSFLADRFSYVFGLGKSGRSALGYFQKQNLPVKAWDDTLETRQVLDPTLLQDPKDVNWSHVERIILSPGIPHEGAKANPALIAAKDHNIPLVVDVELFLERALRHPNHTIVGITGTNGKSTTTSLLTHLLNHLGKKAIAAGNIGTPVLDLPETNEETYYVLELSSYQLTLLKTPRLDVAILINITPDHLAYHGTMEAYVAAKSSIFEQVRHQKGVIIIDDAYTQKIYKKNPFLMSISTETEEGKISIHQGILKDKERNITFTLPTLSQLQGSHNAQNIGACYGALRHLIPETFCMETFIEGLQTFKALPHRQEIVAQTNQVIFVNDSKATNMDAAEKSLKTFQNIHWILGGEGKVGETPASLKHLFPHVKHVYLVGSSMDFFEKEIRGLIAYTRSHTVEQATDEAFHQSQKGDVILLAPACASFDQFKNFEERGSVFKTCALKLVDQYHE